MSLGDRRRWFAHRLQFHHGYPASRRTDSLARPPVGIKTSTTETVAIIVSPFGIAGLVLGAAVEVFYHRSPLAIATRRYSPRLGASDLLRPDPPRTPGRAGSRLE